MNKWKQIYIQVINLLKQRKSEEQNKRKGHTLNHDEQASSCFGWLQKRFDLFNIVVHSSTIMGVSFQNPTRGFSYPENRRMDVLGLLNRLEWKLARSSTPLPVRSMDFIIAYRQNVVCYEPVSLDSRYRILFCR